MSRVANVLSLNLNPRASCQDCAWETSESRSARDRARLHVQALPEHSVEVVTEKRDLYRMGP